MCIHYSKSIVVYSHGRDTVGPAEPIRGYRQRCVVGEHAMASTADSSPSAGTSRSRGPAETEESLTCCLFHGNWVITRSDRCDDE